ncbi:MAG: bifunctional glutamate--cysteine ligase GshA/glutathione synthetase GshB [Aerococcus sp.]|nr:bifunctional glutamate--cysteine ligase GshA/glutathione synthetase GshB [Aerococcus sp.]
MNRLQTLLVSPKYRANFQKTTLGIEREDHRVHTDGTLVKTHHPKTIDGAKTNPYIKRDFAESQLELVTPVTHQVKELMQWLEATHVVTLRSLPADERMWTDSMPPAIIDEKDIRVAQFNDNPEAVAYRNHLIETYGKRLQTISGIHFNWGLDPEWISKLYQELAPEESRTAFQSALYLKIARSFLCWQWLIIYLFGNSPFADESFYPTPNSAFTHPLRSIRNSRFGYRNAPDVKVSYHSLARYVSTLEENVQSGRLSAEKELYATVRLRGANHARKLLKQGIQYLEFRLFDIQGQEPCGITASDVQFMNYFALYLLYRDETVTDEAIERGNQRAIAVAEEDCRQVTAYQEEGLAFLDGMRQFLIELAVPSEITALVDTMRERLLDPMQTPAAQTVQQAPTVQSWLELSLERAKRYYQAALEAPYALRGFEDMELSTQILIADAIQQGIQVEILDRTDQFLRLSYNDHVEYVRSGNITSRDDFISYFKQGNKVVTKRIMQGAGFPTPHGETITKRDDLSSIVSRYQGQPLVVKPKATNMGIGISIFKQGASAEDLKRALHLAFEADDTVMIESFARGTEYRFFVLNGKTKAVLLRIPANVTGDGQQTIRELVRAKNEDPWRGDNHRTPLTNIQLGEAEALNLKQQGLTFDSVPKAGVRVWLRENSNVSTGGDSIDVTDDMEPSYLAIASAMAKALDVKITGLDLMIEDRHQPAISTPGENNYTFIESNFNPMMMMHIYPEEGPGRRLTKDLLQFLFPEKPIK